jgi:hypothetical protein
VSVSLWDVVSRKLLWTAVTSGDGRYGFEAPLVKAGQSYGVTPRPTREQRFDPVGRTVPMGDRDEVGVDFTAMGRGR